MTSAVLDTGVSWHDGGIIKSLLKPLNTIALWSPTGFRGALYEAERRQSDRCSFSVYLEAPQ